MKKSSFTIKAFLLILLPLLGFQQNASAQTDLNLGDIAFVAYQGDNPDVVAIILLKDIVSNTQITLTDHGWFANGGFRDTENELTVTFNTNVPCGEIITISADGPQREDGVFVGANAGTMPAFSTGGDQCFIYQGTAPVSGDESNFIAAIQMNGAWDDDATSSNTSARPSVFTDGVNSLAIDPEADNAAYFCETISGLPSVIAGIVNDAANWTSGGDPFTTFPYTCDIFCEASNPNNPCIADAGDLLPAGPLSICEGEDTPEFTADYSAMDEDDPNMGGPPEVGPFMYEIRIDQPSNDDDEYFELYGTPGLDLSDFTYLVIGDGAGGSGVIENVTPLTGQTIPASGYFVAAMDTYTFGTPDLEVSLNFENSDNVTHLLVKDFTGANGDDLDTDDDGTLDVTPWSSVQDALSLVESVGSGDQVYGVSLGFNEIGPDGTFVPGHVFFDGVMWNIGQFDPVGGDDTPGSGPTPVPTASTYSYFWVVTDGAPDYNIIAVEQGNLNAPYGASFSGLAPGTYCVHGLSFLGSLGDLLAEGFTTGVEVLTAIADEDICGDLEVDLCIPLTITAEAVADAGQDQLVCEGDQVFVSAFSDGATGEWTGGAGTFDDASANFTEYFPDASEIGTTVTLTWTTDDPDGPDGPCTDATDDVNITILEGADAEFSYDMDEYCPNGTDPILSHTTGTDGVYTYTVVSGGPTLDLDPETGAISLAGSDQGVYDVTNTVGGCGNLVISGIIDGPITGGIPKAVEFTAVEDIPDLSIYGFGGANNGGGSDGIEFTFPGGSLAQGEHVWVATESVAFTTFFGFAPDYVDNVSPFAPSINGDDAIELFCNGVLIDLFGDQNVDGSGEPWEYLDGWAYRNNSTGPNGGGFNPGNWIFSGPNALDDETDNASAATPMPEGTYFSTIGGVCPNDEFTVTITIQDIEAPVITCPEDIEIVLGPGACGAFVNFEVTAVDNCDPNPTIIQTDAGGLGAGDFYEIGVYELDFEASDIFGNSSGCSFTITINEFPNPTETLTCNDEVVIALDATGVAQIGADMILEGGPYGCYDDYVVSIEGGDDLVDCDDIGFEMTVSVTDPETGNYCWGTIIVEDKLAPAFDCPTTPTQISCIQDPNLVLPPVATDNCTPVDYQQIDELFQDTDACDDNTVVLMRVWIAVDEYGNISDECLQYINIVRPDEIDFPNDIHWECTQYEDYGNIIEPALLNPTVAALQVGNDPIIATGITNGFVLSNTGSGVPSDVDGIYCQYGSTHADEWVATCGNTFKIIRTWTVLDWCTGEIITGNSSGEDNVQVIKIVDSTPPSVTLAPYTVSANIQGVHPQPCRSTDILQVPVISDLCSDWTLRIFTPIGEADYVNGVDGADGAVIPAPGLTIGVHIIHYQVEDECGNVTDLNVEVEVVDDIVPVTICDEITDVALTSDGIATVFAETFDDGSYDNCCLDEFLVRRMDGDCAGNFDDFGPSVDFCCSDIADNPIMVVFRAVDCYGNYNECMVEVEVEDKLPPFVVCPPDATITCDEYLEELDAAIQAGDYTLLEQFGDATFNDNCEPIDTYEVIVNVNTCAEGDIIRSWEVTDPSGNVPAACTQTIFVEHVSDWVVEFPEDLDAVCTDGDLPEFGEPAIFHDECELIGTSYEDTYFYIVPDACYKIERTWTVINWCVYDDYGYDVWEEDGFAECDLFQDWDGDGDRDCLTFRDGYNESGTPGTPDGYIDYMQIIKVTDVDEPTFEIPEIDGCIVEIDCDKDLVIPYPIIDDVCSPDFEVDITGSFGVFNDIQGDLTIDDVVPGTYNIYYTVTDNCGNQAYDDITVVVEDCKKPTPYCKNGVIVELMQTGMVDIWASDFNAGSFDNCPGDLIYSFSSDVTDTGLTLDCDDFITGQLSVEIWVTDATGNQDFCDTYVIVQDNMNACNNVAVTIAGAIQTEEGDGVEDVNVQVNGGLFSVITDVNGAYDLEVDEGGDYSIFSVLDGDDGNGVTTYDLVLITQHILGITPLSSPYKMIAADANASQSITTLDLVEIRKIILQLNNEFPNTTSWVFIDEAYTFPNPSNPWQTPFPYVINVNNLDEDQLDADFIGVKIGDVNGSAQANFMMPQDRNLNGNLMINADDVRFQAGETFKVDFTAADAELLGYQFTMNFETAGLELIELVDGIATAENFGMAMLEEGAITASWNTTEAMKLQDEVLFSLVFKALTDGQLSDVLNINSRYTVAEAYNAQSELMDVQLELGASTTANFQLYQNVPNPFKGETIIGFNLPEAGNATLTISDVSGKVLHIIDANYEAGYNQVRISNLAATGVLYYQLDTANDSATKKMIIIE